MKTSQRLFDCNSG